MAIKRPEGGMPDWVVPLLLFLTGLAPLLLARTTECLSLDNGTATPDQVCSSHIPLGAWVFAGICWLAALIVFLAARNNRAQTGRPGPG
ncbi:MULTISPECIES: hypothetical protein [unclassified Luteococcus]|uniref:hypothetical protein n=1 Tax=unclassified Luteococcus TaxID=2639923 RepID=UPI00313DF253